MIKDEQIEASAGAESPVVHKNSEEILATARSLEQAKDLSAAYDLLFTAIQRDPENTELLNAGGQVAFKLKKYGRAITWASKSVSLDEDNAKSYVWLVDYLLAVDDVDSALEAAEKALALAPRSLGPKLRMSLALQKAGQNRQAAINASRATAQAPGNEPAWRLVVGTLYDAREFQRAAEFYDKMPPNDPSEALTSIRTQLVRFAPVIRRTDQTILVMGNCNTKPLAACLELLSPRSRVEFLKVPPRDIRDRRRWAPIIRRIQAADVVFYQPYVLSAFAAHIKGRLSVSFPVLYFPAFHPDQTTIAGSRKQVAGAIGVYNSYLAFDGARRGLTAIETMRTFSAENYRRLGYLSRWKSSVQMLATISEEASFPLGSRVSEWMKRGCFMHHYNHPKLFVLEDIAKILLRRIDQEPEDIDCTEYIPDSLLEWEVFPVYPEVAAEFGWRGGYTFKSPLLDGRQHVYNLEEFIETSLQLYLAQEPDKARVPREIAHETPRAG